MKLEHVNVIKMDVTLSYMQIFNSILLVNYYAPNYGSTQVQTLSEICDIIDKMGLEQDMTIVWGGDFHLYFYSFLDTDGGKPQLKMNSLTKLLSIMS